MDEAALSAYKLFMNGPGGADLMERLKMTEAKYQMQGMQTNTIEGKGIAMTKIGVSYEIRTMLNDIVTPSKPVQSQSGRSAGSK